MTPSHPNRSPNRTEGSSPSPQEIRLLRSSTGLNRGAFGAIIYAGDRAVEEWEQGTRRMHPCFWEALNTKIKGSETSRALVDAAIAVLSVDMLRGVSDIRGGAEAMLALHEAVRRARTATYTVGMNKVGEPIV